MRRVLLPLLLAAGSVFAGELLKEGRLLTGAFVGPKSEPLPLLIELEEPGCTLYAVAVLGDVKRVWIRPERLYCGERRERVRGFVTDGEGVLGLACDTLPCFLEKGTRVRVFLEKESRVLSLENMAEDLAEAWRRIR